MAEVLKKQRKSNFSQDEVETIVKAVMENYETFYGEFSKKAINKIARHKAWLEVTKEVNLVSSEKRTLQEVKNKWKKCQHLYRSDDHFPYNSFSDDVLDVTNVWEPLTEIEDEDSMPLGLRLKSPLPVLPPEPTEPVLQSQPLSPTKLKVTRQAKPSLPSPKPPTPPPPPPPIEEVCLKWNSHHSNMQHTFPSLLLREQYVDATLVAEGQTLKCHRVILSSCSPYFEEVLASISPYQHPVLFMKDTPFWILKSLCDFMYSGEVHILQTKLEELLAVAENLKIKGLAGQEEVKNQEIKPEVPDIIKEEIKEEVKKKEEKEVKRKEEKEAKKKEEKEIKKREEKEIKKKEEKEIKKKEEKEIKKKEEKEIKKKEEKEIKKKEEKEAKPPEVKQIKRKEEKEIKKRDEKETKEKKRAVQLAPLVEMPVLKSSKTIKIPLQQSEMPVLKSTKPPRGSGISRRTEKRTFEKEKIEKPLPSKDISHKKDFFDPILDLLEPVYEEVAKDPKPTKAIVPKDPKNITVRRNVQKKLKKRKITDDREESPPPIFTRKGTRSRPNRKVPKYFHPPDDQSTIVREPHTDQADLLMHLQCIKSEPIYEDSIEIEDNLVGFSESSMSVEEQLIGSYAQSSFGDYNRRTTRSKQKEMQPIIMDVQSIANQKEETTLNIINVAQLTGTKLIDPLEDPLTLNQTNSDSPAIVQGTDNTLGFRISQVVTEKEDSRSSEACTDMGFQITNVVSAQEVPKKSEEIEENDSMFTEFEASAIVPKIECSDTMNDENITPVEEPEPMDTNEEDQSAILPTTSFDDTINKSNEEDRLKDSSELIDNYQSSSKECNYADNEFIESRSHDNFKGTLVVKTDLINKNEEDQMSILPGTSLQGNTTQDTHEFIGNSQPPDKETFAADNKLDEMGSQDEFVDGTSVRNIDHNTGLEPTPEAEILPNDTKLEEPPAESEILPNNTDLEEPLAESEILANDKDLEEPLVVSEILSNDTDLEEPLAESDTLPTDLSKVGLPNETSSLQDQHTTSAYTAIVPTDSIQEEPEYNASSMNRNEETSTVSFEEAHTSSVEEDPHCVNKEKHSDSDNFESSNLKETTNSNNNLETQDMAESQVGEIDQLMEVVEDELAESAKNNEENQSTNDLNDSMDESILEEGMEEESSLNTGNLENVSQEYATLMGNKIQDETNMEFSEDIQEREDRLEKELLQENNDISSNFDCSTNDKNYENNLLNDDYVPGEVSSSIIPNEAYTMEDNSNASPENYIKDGATSDEPNEHLDAENSSNTVPETYVKNESNSNEDSSESNTNVFPERIVEAGSSAIVPAEAHISDESSSNILNKEYVTEESDSNTLNENFVPEKKTSNTFNENCATNDNNAILPITEKGIIPNICIKESSMNGPSDNYPAVETKTYSQKSSAPELNCQTDQASSSTSLPGFHIAQVISEQIAEIEGNRYSGHFSNNSKDLSASCEKNFNELESIVNDLSKIVGDTCGSLESESMDDTNSIADSLENLLQK
ncbi:unnamed protein product [Psylliodes chrysocephalus]|uniref:Regulatory protein zeste n=1 Tax=Psylliodes chrysocephalus TaxID=3402493 RepID=A0A9P0GLA2_9CUCU|nr:unnamed protein product [Psylliodes chrysocephala]